MTGRPGAQTGGPIATPLMTRAVELLRDGEWHDFDSTLRELSKLVPPGPAIRRNERDRRQHGRPAVRQIDPGYETRIASGKRGIARDTLKHPYFEIYPVKPGRAGVERRVRMIRVPSRVLRDQARGLIWPEPIDGASIAQRIRNTPPDALPELLQEGLTHTDLIAAVPHLL